MPAMMSTPVAHEEDAVTSDSPREFVQATPKLPSPADLAAPTKSETDLDVQAPGPLRVVEAVRRIEEMAPLAGYQREMVTVVGRLLADGVDVLQVAQVVAGVNDALTTRLLHLAEAELGRPPCDYAWLALGSHGRGEQVLSSDQDSALAYDDRVQATEAGYFPRLAGLVVPALASAGLPLCDGGYMATKWCHPISEYRSLFGAWVEQPRPDALLKAEVFLDVRPVHGDLRRRSPGRRERRATRLPAVTSLLSR